MISPLPSYDDDLLSSAYANISLIADKTWTFDHEDPYHKLNHSLWIQSCEVAAKYEENGDYRPRLVRDVISESRLAKYGNYEYDEQRERMYRPDDGKSSSGLWHFRPAEATEPWMLPEVQDFARLISPSCNRAHRESSALPVLKCDVTRRESKVSLNIQSDWSEGSKKRRQMVSPKESRRIGSKDDSHSIRKFDESDNREIRGKLIRTFPHCRYTLETAAEIQLQSRIESDAVRNIWDFEKSQQRQQFYQQAQQSQAVREVPNVKPTVQQHPQFYCTLQYQPLILKADHQRHPPQLPPAILSAEVPEFFPKSSPPPVMYLSSDKQYAKACQMCYFSSLSNRNFQSELFPYHRPQHETASVLLNARMSVLPATEMNVFRPPQEWIQRIAPPPMQIQVASTSPQSIGASSLQPIHDPAIAHRPLQMYEKFSPRVTQPSPTTIPVYQRPMELYQEPASKRKSHGVDFKNLILLTKNSPKVRRGGHSKGAQQSLLLESAQSMKSGQKVIQWLDKDCTKRTKRVVSMNALVSELRNFEEKYDYGGKAGANWKISESPPQRKTSEKTSKAKDELFESESSRCGTTGTKERDKRTKRPLYRDVLANASSGQEMILENIFDRRYDELEQQALEQYRNSEESLALKYQELERQAMEQYRNSNVTDEKQLDSCSISYEDQDCQDGQKCSGYGQCSPPRKSRDKKGSCLSQITLLKPKGKSLPNVSHGLLCKDNNQQAAVASRSLSTLIDGSSNESKNISKGASGDKLNRSVRTSSKRRLILVSPFEHESEARLMKMTDLKQICSISQTKKNVLGYCHSSKVAQNGSGDEHITIIQSPSTEERVWLSGFWST